jgi:hypothetical protein
VLRLTNLYSTGSTGLGGAMLGFLLAPLISAFLTVSAVVFLLLATIPGTPPDDPLKLIFGFLFAALWGTAAMGAPFTYLGMALIGLPAWLLLRFTNNESGLAYGLVGGAGGFLLAPTLGGHKWEGFPLDLAGLGGGALAMLLFWSIGRRR